MKANPLTIAAVTAAAMFCFSTPVFAQDSGSSASADKTFLMNADEGNTAEISASQLALKKSKNPDVKQYAQQMITDHQQLRTQMKPLASQMGVNTPQPLNATHKAEAARLRALSGQQFDMEYIKAMDQDHHKTLDMFKNEVATTQNDQLKQQVQQGEQVIQQHTDMADQLAQKMNVQTGVTPSM